jgi:hypothetical protein
LAALSAKGDSLEKLGRLVDFEAFRPDLERAVPHADRAGGGRPPFDHVLMFKSLSPAKAGILILQTSHSLSDERTEFLIKDRLSFMRFLQLSLADAVPDARRRSRPCSAASTRSYAKKASWRSERLS